MDEVEVNVVASEKDDMMSIGNGRAQPNGPSPKLAPNFPSTRSPFPYDAKKKLGTR